MQTAIPVLAVAAYTLTAIAFYLRLVQPDGVAIARATWCRKFAMVAVLLHFVDIYYQSVASRSCPVTSAQFALSLAGLIAMVAFLILARQERALSLGAMVVPMSFALFLASTVIERQEIRTHVPSWFLAVHVTSNLLGVGLYVFAAATSVAYVLQSKRLKEKKARRRLWVFPGLISLELQSHRLLLIGFALSTIGVVSGAVFAERLVRGDLGLLRIVLSYLCWLVAATVAIGQRVTGWHGRKVAWGVILTAILAVLVVLLYSVSSGGNV